ncbi:TadE/TadG family type IV pilus assembly protein [Sinomonas mesophila]|uniref:TadE/TadG family type IV pilus assembly protein n=1 Tax=Sinomonas mesophila TaxID=1531955 RepID=UPI00111598C4|nr:TadE/TadG family type IV pilus assembly protein [Sinomonas mesophila]
MRPTERDRGAAAVEMALVLPVLVTILLGIIDFGRAFNAQQVLTFAAREGVRAMALENSQATAREASREAASTLGTLPDSSMAISPAACTPGTRVSVTVSYTLPSTGFFGQFPLQGKGVMLCGG